MAVQKTEIRIVAGSLRGRKLVCHVHEGMRPTPQMVREALFSILGNAVPGRPFYDVFAGTGVVGLEAVSRGASRASLVERDNKLANEIQKYADRFAVADRAHVVKADGYRWAERWVPPAGGPVNVFFSPPFPDLQPDKLPAFLKLVRDVVEKAPDDSVIVVQAEDPFPVADLPGDPAAWDVRKYGRNLLLFLVKGDEVAPAPEAGQNGDDAAEPEGE